MSEARCLAAALEYCRRGWPVLPIKAHDKRPLLAWEPFQRTPPDEVAIRKWFARWPDADVGILTGAVSGLVVLDVDAQHQGLESLSRIEAAWSALPPTVECRTGGGGRHLYYRHPGGQVRNKAGLSPGIDLRGDGGYVVAPPSIHPSGSVYEWLPRRSPADIEARSIAVLACLGRFRRRPAARPSDRPLA